MEWKHGGATRTVLLIGRFAIKFPKLYSWQSFLCGLLSNMQERVFAATEHPRLCPVLFSIPGGWLVVMERCRPMTREEWFTLLEPKPLYAEFRDGMDMSIPVERKMDSFGFRANGDLVAIDYG